METSIAKKQPNDLMVKVLKHIKHNPKSFDMDFWGEHRPSCGTVACFAGHATLLNGDMPLWEIFPEKRQFEFVRPLIKNSPQDHAYFEKPEAVVDRAAKLLELDAMDADRLFFGDFQDFGELLRELENAYHYDFSSVDWDDFTPEIRETQAVQGD